MTQINQSKYKMVLINYFIKTIETDKYGAFDMAPIEKWLNVKEHEYQYSKIHNHDGKLWLTSDIHFGHDAIIEFAGRPFKTLAEMENFIVDQHNSVVSDDDIVIWVGDFSFINAKASKEILKRCKGYHILIVGNHDFNGLKVKQCGFDEVYLSLYVDWKDNEFALTHYPCMGIDIMNIHGHIHDAGFPSFSSRSPHHYNVCCEFHNFTPKLIDDIIDDIQKEKHIIIT